MEPVATAPLPNDVEQLKRLVLELEASNRQKALEVELLREQVAFFQDKLFGRRAERWSPDELAQMWLFNEAELGSAEAPEEGGEPEEPPIAVRPHHRQPRGRKPLPEGLERVVIEHDLPEAQKQCGCGALMSRIGEKSSEQLDIIPAQVRVLRHVRPTYACRLCDGEHSGPGEVLKRAPAPPQMIPKSIASPGLLAHVLVSKFEDALPFYRQEKQFRRLGVQIPRATMCHWALEVARRCEGLLELLWKQVLCGPLVQVDETPVQVLKEPGRAASTKSSMWVFLGGSSDSRAVLYQYHRSRGGDVPLLYLREYEGYVQSDGYVGYDELSRQPTIQMLGCWAHARRKFFEVTKVTNNAQSAQIALGFIRKLYEIEHLADEQKMKEVARAELRQSRCPVILEAFKTWLDQRVTQIPPTSRLGKAVNYTLGQWPRLIRYPEAGFLHPDNNLALCSGNHNPQDSARTFWKGANHGIAA